MRKGYLCILVILSMLMSTMFCNADETPLAVGENVVFGRYEQDNQAENGAEPIEWICLAVEDGKALLITCYGIEGKQYHAEYLPVTWENCTLRAWLNKDLLETALSEHERACVLAMTLKNEDNSSFRTDGGNQTVDRVFLLSVAEAKKYFASAAARMTTPTAHAIEHSVYVMNRGNTKDNCFWWLRTPGKYADTATYVKHDGTLLFIGIDVDYFSAAVRPAVWVDEELFLQIKHGG